MDFVERVDRRQSGGLFPDAIPTIVARPIPDQHSGRTLRRGFLEARLIPILLALWRRRVRRFRDAGLPGRYVEVPALPAAAVGRCTARRKEYFAEPRIGL